MQTRTLPEFPWDTLAPYGATAAAHPDGIVDLSIGTPVDPTPAVVRAALAAAADAPGYPTVVGTPAVREAAVRWLERRAGVVGVAPTSVLPTVGSKELVALLPSLLGLGPGHRVLLPELAYPTYDVGTRAAGAVPEPCDDPRGTDPTGVKVLWLNSPSNPTGQVLDAGTLAARVAWAREHDVLVVSDECYLEFGYEAEPVSVLHPEVCGGDHTGLLALHSLSKRSNLAGYRFGFAAGDPAVVAELVAIRKHLGLMVPAPVQAAGAAALDDDDHVAEQLGRYRARREVLRPAFEAAGWRVEHSEAGLYLWLTRDDADCWEQVSRLAGLGVLVAPGAFYGAAGGRFVRAALTATDERIAAAARRLRG